MVIVSITYDSEQKTGIARTFEHYEDAALFATSYVKNSSVKETPKVTITRV